MRFRAVRPKVPFFLFQKLPAAGNQDWFFSKFSVQIPCIGWQLHLSPYACIWMPFRINIHMQVFNYYLQQTCCVPRASLSHWLQQLWASRKIGAYTLAISTPTWRMKNTHFETSNQISFAIFSVASNPIPLNMRGHKDTNLTAFESTKQIYFLHPLHLWIKIPAF